VAIIANPAPRSLILDFAKPYDNSGESLPVPVREYASAHKSVNKHMEYLFFTQLRRTE
jgi:hypothetical protein